LKLTSKCLCCKLINFTPSWLDS